MEDIRQHNSTCFNCGDRISWLGEPVAVRCGNCGAYRLRIDCPGCGRHCAFKVTEAVGDRVCGGCGSSIPIADECYDSAAQSDIATSASRRISDIGVRTEGGLACPACGGTNFKVRRRPVAKGAAAGAAVGVAVTAVFVPVVGAVVGAAAGAAISRNKATTEVECVTCAARYERG